MSGDEIVNNVVQFIIWTNIDLYFSVVVKGHTEKTLSAMHHILSVLRCRSVETDGLKWNEWLKARLQYI